MKTHIHPDESEWADMLRRPARDQRGLDAAVAAILREVREGGDAAVLACTRRFDQVDLSTYEATEEAFVRAAAAVPDALKQSIRQAQANIERFHAQQYQERQIIETMPGVKCWRKSVPIERVGLYVPGGTAPLFSTVLMLGVPAQLAGCRDIVLCSPPRRDGTLHPAVLHTAREVGITRVFLAGGAQAIAALAYGTETVPAVYKILGPGNRFVTAAKQLVCREGVAIDMPAGPSEVLVCADATAEPTYVAADLLSQAEHGADSQVILLAFDEAMVGRVQSAVECQLAVLPRRRYAEQALAHSSAVIVRDRHEAVALINAYAPEHLILSVEAPEEMAEQIVNAGSVFLGNFTPESVGDYAAGTNHVLPTNGFARAYGGVSLDSFLKKITFQHLSPQGLALLGSTIEQMAEAEGLSGHKRAVSVRLADPNVPGSVSTAVRTE